MYKTTRINISERLKLDGGPDGGYFVEIVPMVWLPYEVTELYTKWAQDTDALDLESPITSEQMSQQNERIGSILQHVVVDWNLVDLKDEPISLPSEENPEAWRKLPAVLMQLIVEVAGEDDGEIPLVKEALSQVGSQPPPPQNRQERRELVRNSPDGSSEPN